MNVTELNEIDIEILDYISKFKEIHIDEILIQFPIDKYCTLRRIEIMSTSSKINEFLYADDNFIGQKYDEVKTEFHSTDLLKTGYYYVTPYGFTYLQNHNREKRNQSAVNRKELFFKLAPIIISFVALAKSFENEITLAWQLITRLLK